MHAPNMILSLLLHAFFGVIAFFSSVKNLCAGLFSSQHPLHCTAPRPPQHLAIVFPPQHKNPNHLLKDILNLISACIQLDIPQISIYDPNGVAKTALEKSVSEAVQQQYSLSLKPYDRNHVLTFISDDHSSIPSSCSSGSSTPLSYDEPNIKLVVRLLDKADGQPQLADIARDMADACLNKYIKLSDITQPSLSEKVTSIMPEAELLVVFGGSALRLYGYPPWQLRLTEIFHIPSSVLSTPHATNRNIQSALDAFSACTQRHGR